MPQQRPSSITARGPIIVELVCGIAIDLVLVPFVQSGSGGLSLQKRRVDIWVTEIKHQDHGGRHRDDRLQTRQVESRSDQR